MKSVNLFFLSCLLAVLQLPLSADEHVVEVRAFSELAISRNLQFPASVINLQMADIAAETSGRVLKFPLQVGDKVQQGDLLLEIDCTLARINKDR
ncbi:MAG: biotin/lipoyl-binding protein, partial [Gammaproteobacteria bacterium]|nr:biotin/lipoyl-binding protein [Gammaproteobacteria bacterium]